MRVFRTTLWLSVWLTLVACGGNTQLIHYNAPDDAVSDWFPIPADAPESAILASPVVPRLVSSVSLDAPSDQEGRLFVAKMTDSLGNSSLRFNREPSATWELVDGALAELGYSNLDKDRSKYRFVMTGNGKKLGPIAQLFAGKKDELFLLLVPQGIETLVVVEGVGDEIPDLNQSESILSKLHAHFQNPD